MKKFSQFVEAVGKTAVFTFGRFNPPTIGHQKLLQATTRVARKEGGKAHIFGSHSQDKKKNPLTHTQKMHYLSKMFPKEMRGQSIVGDLRTAIDVAVKLNDHDRLVMVVGSDRVNDFESLLTKYNGVDARHGFYEYSEIKVVSAGDRDPDAEGVTGMSASKMRAAAAQGDFDSFKMGVPKNFGDAKKLYDDVRKNMGVREQNWTDEEIMRDAYIRGEVWNVGDVVKTKLGEEGTIIRKGTNYVVFEDMQRVWLHDLVEEPKKITKTRQAKGDVADVKGTQPAKYYSKDAEGDEMSKSTKIARARYFAKGGSRGPAPGDKGAKTKPSQYTKKFKQMYGEQEKEPPKSDQQKKRDEFDKLQKAKRIAALQYRVAKDQETIAKMSQQNERSLTDAEKDKLKKLEKEIPMKSFKDRYGKDGKSVYYATLTKMAKNESYEIGKDYADHTKEIDPYSAPEETNEKSTLKKDKKLPNLMLPKKGKAGVTKFMRRKNLQKLAADVQADIDEQPTHEITVGDYTTKFFHMCGSAQTVMKKHANKEGAEELTIMQDVFYKMEKDAMDNGGASDEQKQKAEILYDKIMTKAEDMGIASEVDKYMKLHLTSMTKGEPKLGFGRTDISESLWANIHKKRQRIKQGSGERMRKKGEKGAPTAAQMKRAKGEEVEVIDEKIAGLVKKSEQTGVPYGILKKSYDRGMAAWKGGHRPGTTQQQWAFARVNSMLTGGKADPDLQAKIKAGGYKKKKKAKKENVEEWYNDTHTKQMYQERYGSNWEEKLNNTYERMLSKLDESCCEDCAEQFDHMITEAEYQGKKVKLNDPIRTSENPKKKFKVYVKNEKGKVVVVRFGDPNMGINRDDPEARKSFRARHNCDNPGPKTKARYWSCFQWRAGAKVDN